LGALRTLWTLRPLRPVRTLWPLRSRRSLRAYGADRSVE